MVSEGIQRLGIHCANMSRIFLLRRGSKNTKKEFPRRKWNRAIFIDKDWKMFFSEKQEPTSGCMVAFKHALKERPAKQTTSFLVDYILGCKTIDKTNSYIGSSEFSAFSKVPRRSRDVRFEGNENDKKKTRFYPMCVKRKSVLRPYGNLREFYIGESRCTCPKCLINRDFLCIKNVLLRKPYSPPIPEGECEENKNRKALSKVDAKHGHRSRVVANLLERRRVAELNTAFEKLRRLVPMYGNEERALSKIKTLKYAITYIKHLMEMMECEQTFMRTQHSDSLMFKTKLHLINEEII